MTNLLKTAEVADQLGIGIVALEIWRQHGTGPTYIKVGRLVRYKQSDVDIWIKQRTVTTEHKSGLKKRAAK